MAKSCSSLKSGIVIRTRTCPRLRETGRNTQGVQADESRNDGDEVAGIAIMSDAADDIFDGDENGDGFSSIRAERATSRVSSASNSRRTEMSERSAPHKLIERWMRQKSYSVFGFFRLQPSSALFAFVKLARHPRVHQVHLRRALQRAARFWRAFHWDRCARSHSRQKSGRATRTSAPSSVNSREINQNAVADVARENFQA